MAFETQSDRAGMIERIWALKRELGKQLIILTHHYQRKEIVDLGDFVGDSFELSRRAAADRDCRYIVFCGVHFMAESAAILAQPDQVVQIPDVEAGCWMAEMAEAHTVKSAWEQIESIAGAGSIIPVVYMNSDAELKSFCGNHGGLVCTSSNAAKAVRWGFGQKDKILFFPDQHLGRNVGHDLGMAPEEMIVWSPGEVLGGNVPAAVRNARMILWDGYCLVHTRFTVEHIEKMRAEFPEARIIVHPECTREVVARADACGSTSYIVKYVSQAAPGSTIVIGTEINLIDRLALEYPDRKVLDLHRSLCPNMFRINLGNLLRTLENIGEMNVVEVPEEIKDGARLALGRMLALA
ncbi:MAG TPA: quinolinate synthase NadA [Syntrophobacteraceae bacterium]|nr:quinolinate synthase NadA [Syntrophobacteraceae bacterium]